MLRFQNIKIKGTYHTAACNRCIVCQILSCVSWLLTVRSPKQLGSFKKRQYFVLLTAAPIPKILALCHSVRDVNPWMTSGWHMLCSVPPSLF